MLNIKAQFHSDIIKTGNNCVVMQLLAEKSQWLLEWSIEQILRAHCQAL